MATKYTLLSALAAFNLVQAQLNIPSRVGSVVSLPSPSQITGSVDLGNKEFDRGQPCNSDEDTGSDNAVFILSEGASLSNVIIGPNQLEGIHCEGSCTLKNVWFRDVCEDAITILGAGDATITGGGAQEAKDKVVQHNGAGTVTIDGFSVVNVGKLYRSCGNCSNNKKNSPRKVIVKNVSAEGVTSDLVGINSNFGDTAEITGVKGSGFTVCQEFEGIDKSAGGDPKEIENTGACVVDGSGGNSTSSASPTGGSSNSTSSD